MKRINMSQDGIPRFTLKIETRISSHDMAVHLINRFQYLEGMDGQVRLDETTNQRDERLENSIKNIMSSYSTSKLLETVEESILFDGLDTPHYTVSDNGYSKAVEFLQGYLERRFKGFAKMEAKQ